MHGNFPTDRAPLFDVRPYRRTLESIFGSPTDPMEKLEERASRLLPEKTAILWQGDPTTFQFTWVSRSAEEVLGYQVNRWLTEPSFWADVVVHPADREYAVCYCALATGKGLDHEFEYRALRHDGTMLWLFDYVKVHLGRTGIATELRGLMFDVTHLHGGEDPNHSVSARGSEQEHYPAR